MATDTAQTWRRLVRRPRIPDLVLAGFVLLLATAVVVNGVTTVHDVKRARLDKRVAASWFKQHPELGRFGPPRVKDKGARDLACAARRSAADKGNPIDGYCILIADRDVRSTQIVGSYHCWYARAARLGRPTEPRCLGRR
jgi:hypothetical protein